MGMLVLAGPAMNLMSQGSVAVSPAADSLFPTANLFDGDPGTVFRYGSLTADPTITLDLTDGLGGFGALNAWSPAGGTPNPDGWVTTETGGGVVDQEVGNVISGSAALFQPGVGGASSIHRDVAVRAGTWWQLRGAMENGSAGVFHARIQNLKTGKYLSAAGLWQAAITNCLTATSTSGYAYEALAFRVETFGQMLGDIAVLRITYHTAATAASSFLDDVSFLPGVDVASIHGHNIDPLNVVTLRSSTDNFSSSDTVEATVTQQIGAFYVRLAARVYRRYWRVKFTGTNSAASGQIYLGELVIGTSLELQQPPGYPMGLEMATAQVRGQRSQWGGSYAVGLGQHGYPARVPLSFGFHSEAAALEFDQEVFQRSHGGTPVVIVPDTTKADVYFALVPDRLSRPRNGFTFYDVTVEFEVFPPPLVVS